MIPINDGFQTKLKNEHTLSSNFIAILDKNGNIRRGNIALFFPKVGNNKIPNSKTFVEIFDVGKINCNGEFKFLSPTGRLAYQLEYKNGSLFSSGYISPNNSNARISSGCTDWYLITTIYYADGSSTQTEQYITTTCPEGGSNGCSDPNMASICPDDGSGGGASYVDYEYAITRAKDWQVHKNGYYWDIWSTEQISGKKNANGSGYFTGIAHASSRLYAGNAVWTGWNATPSKDSDTQVYIRVQGQIKLNSNQYTEVITESRTWSYSQIF